MMIRRFVLATACTAVLLGGPLATASPARAHHAKPPKSCRKALDKAEEAFLLLDQAHESVDDFLKKVQGSVDAARGLGTQGISNIFADVTTYMDELSATFDETRTDADHVSAQYKTAAAKCRKGLS